MSQLIYLFDLLSRYRLLISLVFVLFAGIRLGANGITHTELIALMCYGSLHWSAYLFNRYTDLGEDLVSQHSDALLNTSSRRVVCWASVFLVLWPIPVLLVLELKIWVYLLLLAALPFYGLAIPGTKFRIKSTLLLKNLYSVCFAWVLPIIAVDYATENLQFSWRYFISIGYFATVIMAYEILWDIRDIDGDQAVGTRTIANVYGVGVAKNCAWLCCFTLSFPYLLNKGPLVTPTQILLALFIFFVNRQRGKHFYTAVLLMQALILLALIAYVSCRVNAL